MGQSSSAYEALVALVEEVAAMAEATREFAASEGGELALLERVRERSEAVAAVVGRVEEAAMAAAEAEEPTAPLPRAEEATVEVEEPAAAAEEQGPRAEIVESLDDLFGDL